VAMLTVRAASKLKASLRPSFRTKVERLSPISFASLEFVAIRLQVSGACQLSEAGRGVSVERGEGGRVS
jgi:hypothetical protein